MSIPDQGAPQYVPQQPQPQPQPQTPYPSPAPQSGGDGDERRGAGMPKVLRGAIWIAIGALLAAAIVCVVWVLIGPEGNAIVGRAFLTILLLAGFSGMVLAEASVAERRPSWLVLASMIGWVVVLLVGAVKIWTPLREIPTTYGPRTEDPLVRVWEFFLVILVVQLAVWHQHFCWKAHQRYVTTFTRVIAITTTALVVLLVGMLVFYLAFPNTFEYPELYWRFVVALAILVVVGTLLIPLLNALFAPKAPRAYPPAAAGAPLPGGYAGAAPSPQSAPQQLLPWPTYADGRTPLPVLPDGSPDWNAYYTGVPSFPQAPPPAPPTQQGHVQPGDTYPGYGQAPQPPR